MSQFQVRTDLALEAREKFEEDNVEVKGVRVEEEYRQESEIKITTMVIETENGAKAMGKPKGTYITLEVQIWIARMRGTTGKSPWSWQGL